MIPEHTTTLHSITDVARDTKKFLFTKPAGFSFEAGQFISLKFGEKAWRAYSVASTPREEFLELVVRLIPGGVGSTALEKARVGDDFVFRGAFGHFVLSDTPDAELIFCGTGTGIAPLRAMIKTEAAKPQPRPMTLYYGGRNAQDVAYLDELKDWAKNLRIFLALSREENVPTYDNTCVENCRITKFLEETSFEKSAEFYSCGNGDMVVSVREILDTKAIPRDKIFQERFN